MSITTEYFQILILKSNKILKKSVYFYLIIIIILEEWLHILVDLIF